MKATDGNRLADQRSVRRG